MCVSGRVALCAANTAHQLRASSAGAVTASASANSGSGAGPSSSKPFGLGNAVPTQRSFATRQPQRVQPGGSSSSSTCTTRGLTLYQTALELARNEQFETARRAFEETVRECPSYIKPWVSWAQMEKRCIPKGDDRRWSNCRTVLQRGLLLNPNAPALLQAWGLMEMQRGNWVAALMLLDRCVQFEPRNSPVLKWKPVVEARQTMGSRRRSATKTN